ncbi:MurR/RpiR family transcriptional regulator [Mesorhizobium sp. M4B.F.Ca.ET.215.01.1.1]|uniref:MurR/RpiR family transcriptional regulator n=1 Tax=unclassified Mesorhizobium TaxID=325217 RepID=UPI000FCA1322|nr:MULTISPECIES: MurR/RpiR family transcriptional regulator [unclassified Mesorhizobium]RUW27201.1 MurR/RpiR family transcriptional regulator [Mesorhizobium sp. M4B.F.Ca.ET.013.02.1.1]RVD41225.1 MurR/RpiR family transcriptional regulator [Mesorhizobium sp. M4B.F.Ca.ET.019.03.1.1]RWA59219.1 MAG: MurR/RpiR family transcriptional regulator [Mesorhizobium sp.]RWF61752.1 MAG: MurR/RpiR family transcriptional regulator [Mesorhizobium sp.]TGQ10618.1 MurR/RpiR family transcriptional regulator [Mesorhi
MKTPADIITRLQLMSQDGTKSDRRLAGLVLSDLDFASKAAISEIAARVGVSEPTVTRFCRNLGCEGLRDFKFYLAQAIAIGGQYLSPEPLSRDAREQRIASAITEAAISAIQRASESLDMTTLVGVAARIATSGNVLCIGSGGISSMMATEMQNRLFRLGLPVLAQIDGQLQRMYAAVATPETTLVAFSVSGYARSVIEAVQVAQQYGATTVAVTAPDSALAKAADTVIHLQSFEDGNIYKPTSSRYALLAIIDMIVTSVAETRGPKVLENLRRIKQSVNTLKVDDPRLPLGD